MRYILICCLTLAGCDVPPVMTNEQIAVAIAECKKHGLVAESYGVGADGGLTRRIQCKVPKERCNP